MNRLSTSLSLAAMVLAGITLSAEDFKPLMQTIQATWPEKKHIGVICDYKANKDMVWALAKALGPEGIITVADAHTESRMGAATFVLSREKADYVVLMPHDRNFGDGYLGASRAVRRLASLGLPVVGTSSAALKQGAVFSIGDRTGGQLLVTDKLIGTVDVILPNANRTSEKASLVLRREGMATVSVHAAR